MVLGEQEGMMQAHYKPLWADHVPMTPRLTICPYDALPCSPFQQSLWSAGALEQTCGRREVWGYLLREAEDSHYLKQWLTAKVVDGTVPDDQMEDLS